MRAVPHVRDEKIKMRFAQVKIDLTRTSANADGPRDAASRKIDHIALNAECNHQAASVASDI